MPIVIGATASATCVACGSLASTRALASAGLTYGRFMNGLKKAGVIIDRKILAELAVNDSSAFTKLVETAKAAA